MLSGVDLGSSLEQYGDCICPSTVGSAVKRSQIILRKEIDIRTCFDERFEHLSVPIRCGLKSSRAAKGGSRHVWVSLLLKQFLDDLEPSADRCLHQRRSAVIGTGFLVGLARQ